LIRAAAVYLRHVTATPLRFFIDFSLLLSILLPPLRHMLPRRRDIAASLPPPQRRHGG